jgi:NADH-quinone oxidoreductase subunit G
LQSFHGVVKALGDTRPAWKVLRVLGNLLGLQGFEQETVEEVRAEALGDVATLASLASHLDNTAGVSIGVPTSAPGLDRITDVPIYATDPIVRRAPALQATADAAPAVVGLPSALWQQLGDKVVVTQGATSVTLAAREDATLAANAVRLPAPHGAAMFGPITVERANA